jgi:hypothetical protein
MVSSTDGASTSTGWKRRSRAASFSTCLRYSSRVVAPIIRSSPRASIGLSMLEASIAPSAAPAPTRVCISSMNVMTSPSEALDLVEDRLEPLLELAPVLGPGHHRRQVEGHDPLGLEALGHVAVGDAPGQALDDGGLADAGLADQHRVVLGPAGEHLDHPPDLVVPSDHRVELALTGHLGEVPPVLLEGVEGGLGVAPEGLAGRLRRLGQGEQQMLNGEVVVLELDPQRLGGGQHPGKGGTHRRLGRPVDLGHGVEARLDLAPERRRLDPEGVEQRVHEPLGLPEQGEEQVGGVDLGVMAPFCLAPGVEQRLL